MYRYTTRNVHCYLWLQEKMHWNMSVQQVWRFMRRILQVHWRRTLYLSLPIDSAGHCVRYANIKGFHWAIYATYIWKYVSDKTRILPYFTQSDVFHWLALRIIHHWTRTVDIRMKKKIIVNKFLVKQLLRFCKVLFSFLTIFNKKATTFKKMSLRSSINS